MSKVKILAMVFAIVFVLSIVACENNTNGSSNKTDETLSPAQVVEDQTQEPEFTDIPANTAETEETTVPKNTQNIFSKPTATFEVSQTEEDPTLEVTFKVYYSSYKNA